MKYSDLIRRFLFGGPVKYQGRQYYVVGYNEPLGNVTIREASNSPLFTVPQDVRPEEIDDEEQD